MLKAILEFFGFRSSERHPLDIIAGATAAKQAPYKMEPPAAQPGTAEPAAKKPAAKKPAAKKPAAKTGAAATKSRRPAKSAK